MSVLTLLIVVLPAWVFVGAAGKGWLGAVFLAYVVAMYSGVRIVAVCVSGVRQPSILMFWLFTYVFYGVCGLAQTVADSYPWGGAYPNEIVLLSYFVVISGMVAFDVGARRALAAQTRLSNKSASWRIKSRRFIWLTPLVIVVTAVSVMKIGGPGVLFQSRTDLEMGMQSSLSSPEAAFFRHMANTPIFVLFLMVVLQCMKAKAWRRLWIGLAAVLGALTVVLNNPVSTPRFQVGAVAIALFFAMGWSRNRALAFSSLMAVGMLVVFPLADAFRVDSDVDLRALISDSPAAVNELVSNGDYDALQQTLNTVDVTSTRGARLGAQVGGALLFWVPRGVWPGKPVPTGEYVADTLGYSYLNLSSPLWAEFYSDGKLLLVLLGLWVYGWALGSLDGAFRRGRDVDAQMSFMAVLGLIMAGYQFFLLRGSLMPAIAYVSPGVAVLLIASFPTLTIRSGEPK